MRFGSVALVLWFCFGVLAAQPQSPPVPQLIQDVRVFDGDRVLEHRSVLIEGGTIRRIGPSSLKVTNADVIDGRGRTLLPGLIDCHAHMPDKMEEAARQALNLGVTTQLDMFNGGARLKRINKMETEDSPNYADVRTAGIGATVPGGHPTEMGGGPIPTLTRPEEAQAFVEARIAEGSDYIKIIHDDGSTWPWASTRIPMLDTPTLRAVVEAAHRSGKLAVVHVLSEQQARDAIEAGADGLAHLFWGDSATPSFGEFAAAHHVFVIPTLTTLYGGCGRADGPAVLANPMFGPYIGPEWRPLMNGVKPKPSASHWCNATDEAVRQLIAARVPILTGTDSPVPGSTYGASVHVELALLVADGMSPVQALAAATSAPARAFRFSDRGWIRPGLRADLLLVQGDPTTDILATRNIVAVWKRGVRFDRQAVADSHNP